MIELLTIERKILTYDSPELGIRVSHYTLIAHADKKSILLSHPNLYLHFNTRSSLKTSSRYSNIISMFYRFLATEDKFKFLDVTQYHVMADNKDIKRWQIARQVKRVQKQSTKPSSETIYDDAKVLLGFFHWLNTHGYLTNVNVETQNSIAHFNRSKLLAYVQAKAKTVINAKNIRVLDKEARQRQRRSLISDSEIRLYMKNFTDPVYPAMFRLALGTAMRPMDLCNVPYLGNGKNSHIMPYSEMNQNDNTFDYTVYNSKGNKTRTIKVHKNDLMDLNETYIIPYYDKRRKKYKERFGSDCPPSILFLNRQGIPITPEKIASRGNAAKMRALAQSEDFRETINFYESRHWWPTMFLISYFKDDLLTAAVDVLWAAVAEVLTNQMGHEDIETTFKHYVDLARVILAANKGKVTELITDSHEGVHAFIRHINSENIFPEK